LFNEHLYFFFKILFLCFVLVNFFKEIGFVRKHESFFECLSNLLNSISLFLYFLVHKLLKLISLKFSVTIKFDHSLVEVF